LCNIVQIAAFHFCLKKFGSAKMESKSSRMKCFSGQKPSDFAGFSDIDSMNTKKTYMVVNSISVSVCESSFGVFVLNIQLGAVC
jgi:hypothetical protein